MSEFLKVGEVMSVLYGERWAQGLILHWINQVIKEEVFPFKEADQEVPIKINGRIKYADMVIWSKTGEKVYLIELKTPMISAYDEELVEDALEKSTYTGIPFFVTWNIDKLEKEVDELLVTSIPDSKVRREVKNRLFKLLFLRGV